MLSPTAIVLLRESIEASIGRKLRTPKDFDILAESIFKKLHQHISPTTLKRLWGYLDENVKPHYSTLNSVARLLGFNNFSHFEQCSMNEEMASAPVLGTSISPASEIDTNCRLRLTWAPDRVCLIRHLGAGLFVVEQSENTRLMPGNTFECDIIIDGEPLYLDNLIQNNRPPIGYVCGKRNGVHFFLIAEEKLK
jgi:hypothetical protein